MQSELPLPHVTFNLKGLDLKQAFLELNKTVYYPENILWDGGYYNIKKHSNGTFTGEAIMFLFSDETEKLAKIEAEQYNFQLNITEEMKQIFNFIESYYQKINPDAPFDSIFVTVQPDGRYIVDYELNEEEVQPNVDPLPEKLTAEYIVQNLHNCLSFNAPDDYIWVWEELTRTLNEEGKTVYGGNFYYSMNDDKSNPQQLEPGEYVYMYNVTEMLFKDFYYEQTKNWSKAIVFFKNNGSCAFKILERKYLKV